MHRAAGGGDRAVTPVIGIILVVAIVVILASVVGVYAFTFDDAPEPAPTVRFDAEYDERTSQNGQYLNVTVQAGERAPTDKLEFRVSGAIDSDTDSEVSLDTDPIDLAGDDLVTQDTISINATSFTSVSGHLDLSDARVDLVWDPDPESGERGQTQPIWTWEDE